jgi:hypothetical protein
MTWRSRDCIVRLDTRSRIELVPVIFVDAGYSKERKKVRVSRKKDDRQVPTDREQVLVQH